MIKKIKFFLVFIFSKKMKIGISFFFVWVLFLDDNNLVIIESNPAWASGIYGCDLSAVLEILKDSVERIIDS